MNKGINISKLLFFPQKLEIKYLRDVEIFAFYGRKGENYSIFRCKRRFLDDRCTFYSAKLLLYS
jgi:hypothetical protein